MLKAIEDAHAEALRLTLEIESLKEQLEANKGVLKGAGKGTHQTAHGRFTIAEHNEYPADAITALLSPGQIRRCMKPKLYNSLVKALYPEVYEQCKVELGFKVTI